MSGPMPSYDVWIAYCVEFNIPLREARPAYKWWRRYFNPDEYVQQFFEEDKKRAAKLAEQNKNINHRLHE